MSNCNERTLSASKLSPSTSNRRCAVSSACSHSPSEARINVLSAKAGKYQGYVAIICIRCVNFNMGKRHLARISATHLIENI